jgi:hypothetical protein
MEDNKIITISPRTLRTVIISFILICLIIWGMSLFIWGGASYRKGVTDGRQAQAIVNPSQSYIESGRAFCYSEGNWYDVRIAKGGVFKVSK